MQPLRPLSMAKIGNGFFDAKGQFHKLQDDATKSDLAAILGKVGEGDSLAPGIATVLFERRADIERIFAEHDEMTGFTHNAQNVETRILCHLCESEIVFYPSYPAFKGDLQTQTPMNVVEATAQDAGWMQTASGWNCGKHKLGSVK